jgi:hypothetical protein
MEPYLAPPHELPLESAATFTDHAGNGPAVEQTAAYQAPAYPPPGYQPPAQEATQHVTEAPPPEPAGWTPGSPEGATATGEAIATRRVRDQADRINWFIPLVFIPLVLYAVLATAAAGFMYIRVQSKPPSIFDQFPDVEGDFPGVKEKGKSRTTTRLNFNRTRATMPLPEHLHFALGESKTVGDLEITPVEVRRQKVGVFVEGFGKPEPCAHDSLVLTLKLRNLSDKYAFVPLDNYFDRRSSGTEESVPLTVLVAGKAKFFGGPARWVPLDRPRGNAERREWVALKGRSNDARYLEPGETMTGEVCTDGADANLETLLARYKGDLLWRVEVRRGAIPWKGKDRSASAVIGVDFSTGDIGRPRKG